MFNMDREHIMKRWDVWRQYIAEGGKASWPRDEFEILLDYFEDEIEKYKDMNIISKEVLPMIA